MTESRAMLILVCLLNGMVGISLAEGVEVFYPPTFNGRPDFGGDRFFVRDRDGEFKGKRPSVMKKKFIVKYEIPPGHHSLPPDINLYLARDIQEEDDMGDDDNQDTLIRYVRTLDDLKGFVKIRTETDALEFLRFGSISYISTEIEEIFCLADTTVLPPDGGDMVFMWATTEQCRRFNLTPPKILNPLTEKERKKLSKLEDDDEEDDVPRHKHRKAGRFFLIERTVSAGGGAPLMDNASDSDVGIFRIVEEVGSEGQWRIVSSQSIGLSQEEFDDILFQSLNIK